MNYYKILGLPKNATYDQIKHQFKKLAIKYHPDKNPNRNANKQFKMITEAYKTLSDPYKRGKYDGLLERQDYSSIYDLFNINFNNAFRSFNDIFSNDPFFTTNFNRLHNIDERQGNKSYSYQSRMVSTLNKDGNRQTKRKVHINDNGNKDGYEDEYIIDRQGNKKYIKRRGNDRLISHSHRLINRNQGGGKKHYRLTYKN
jgi:curved DNA-binding protein CbpA